MLHHTVRKAVVALVALTTVAAITSTSPAAAAAAAAPVKATQHCTAEVVGQADDGELLLSPVECFGTVTDASLSLGFASANAMASSTTLAVHFDGANWTGSSFSVNGLACNAGYVNMPAGWDNRISSTWPACYRTRHYTGANLSGFYVDLFSPGNLTGGFNNETSSVQYIPF